MTALSGIMTKDQVRTRVMRVPGERWLYRIALFAITALAGVLRFANLEALGYANFLAGGIILIGTTVQRNLRLDTLAVACIVAALMITPGIWLGLATLNASTNQTLPAAYNGGQASFGAVGHGGANTDLTGLQVDQTLLTYLESNTQGTQYLMAVPSSMQGADYVIATGRPVLYLGGFNGQDPVETTTSLAQLVSSGALKYIYYGGGGGGPNGSANSSLAAWIQANGTIVQGFDAATQNFGAPGGTTSDGTTTNSGGSLRGFGGGMQITLYELKAGQQSN